MRSLALAATFSAAAFSAAEAEPHRSASALVTSVGFAPGGSAPATACRCVWQKLRYVDAGLVGFTGMPLARGTAAFLVRAPPSSLEDLTTARGARFAALPGPAVPRPPGDAFSGVPTSLCASAAAPWKNF